MNNNIPPAIAPITQHLSLVAMGFIYRGSEGNSHWFRHSLLNYDVTVTLHMKLYASIPTLKNIRLEVYDERMEADLEHTLTERKHLMILLAEYGVTGAVGFARAYKIDNLLDDAS